MTGPAPDFRHDRAGTPAEQWRAHPRWTQVTHLDEALLAPRVVVVAAHPDDETLGAGGLIAYAAQHGRVVEVVVLTDGEASHPDSPTHTLRQLADRRREEVHAATGALAPAATVHTLGLPDGGLRDLLGRGESEGLVARLVEVVGDGRDTLVVAPWRRDGHPDHEAAGLAAAACAARTGARLLEYPVWAWHWADPDQAPWDRMVALTLSPALVRAKALAAAAHHSQVAALSDQPGDAVLLGPGLLAHFAGDRELYVREPVTDPTLDDLQAGDADPWSASASWFEERKRALTTALLPRRTFARGLELGCSAGHLARDLAARCHELVAVDSSAHALAAARATVPGTVELQRLDVPEDWPDGTFDLVVLSEVGYFLSPLALERTYERVRECLAPEGVVVLCHWRHRVDGWLLDGPEVHRRAEGRGLPPVAARYEDRDVEAVVLCHPEHWPAPGE